MSRVSRGDVWARVDRWWLLSVSSTSPLLRGGTTWLLNPPDFSIREIGSSSKALCDSNFMILECSDLAVGNLMKLKRWRSLGSVGTAGEI